MATIHTDIYGHNKIYFKQCELGVVEEIEQRTKNRVEGKIVKGE